MPTKNMQNFRILCLGDVVGRPGRHALKSVVPRLRQEFNLDCVIANGENAAGGTGIDAACADEIRSYGVDVITLGDHTWQKKEFRKYLDTNAEFCIRPANYPQAAPGRGWTTLEVRGVKIGVMNLIGRVFMNIPLDCPFRTADELLREPLKACDLVMCDMHAEATSEKIAMGRYLDGRAHFVVGTHTHVQTADNQILKGGTAYLTDLGMCGGFEGVIGMDAQVAIDRFLTGIPFSYEVTKGDCMVCGAVAEIDLETKRAISVERVHTALSV